MMNNNFMDAKNVLKNAYTFMVVLEAVGCNPNGDPDLANAPRQDFETGLGIITDVATKRRIRNYVEAAYADQPGMEILMQSGTSINKEIAKAVLEANGLETFTKDFKNKKVDDSSALIAKRYWDARTFGAVLATGRNAGQLNGPVQFGMAMSVDPVHVENITITRMCYTDGKDFNSLKEYENEELSRPEDKKRTMGDKKFVSYGLYVVQGTVSANLAAKTGFTESDLRVLFEAIMQMYDFDNTSSKQGMRIASPLIIFKHIGTHPEDPEQNAREALLGCAPAHKLYDMLKIRRKAGVEFGRKLDDYDITLEFSDEMRNTLRGVNIGMKELPFSDIVWKNDDENEFFKTAEANGLTIVK